MVQVPIGPCSCLFTFPYKYLNRENECRMRKKRGRIPKITGVVLLFSILALITASADAIINSGKPSLGIGECANG